MLNVGSEHGICAARLESMFKHVPLGAHSPCRVSNVLIECTIRPSWRSNARGSHLLRTRQMPEVSNTVKLPDLTRYGPSNDVDAHG